MATTGISSAPSEVQPALLNTFLTRVEFVSPTSDTYKGGTFVEINGAIVESITQRLGPEPAEAIIYVPAKLDTQIAFNRRPIFDHKVYSNRSDRNELAPFGPILGKLVLYSKIRIFAFFRDSATQLQESTQGPRIFVGYITEFEYFGRGQDETGFRIHCKDGRELLRRTPAQGVLFYNPDPDKPNKISAGAHTYIRDATPIFNEAQRPNRLHDTREEYLSHQSPRFINVDYNRFIDDPTDFDNHRRYIHDGFLTDPVFAAKVPNPHARKWFPGDVWNYFRNSIDANRMTGSFNPQSGRLFNDPVVDTINEIPPLRSEEILIPVLGDTGQDTDMYHDWFEPRSKVGGTHQTGVSTFVTAIGEFNPNGQPLNEVFHELCRRIGNYTLAVYYDDQDRMVLKPIRTIQARGELANLPVGLRGRRGGTGAGKKIVLTIPTTKDATAKVNVHTFTLKASTGTYANRFHMKAGRRWVQTTFSTVAALQWSELSQANLGTTQVHQEYSQSASVPSTQWVPRLALPTLIPGWKFSDQRSFIDQFKVNGDTELYPDVFRTWIVPQDGFFNINWIDYFNDPTEFGFRRIFLRDRQAMNALIVSLFNVQAGLFRNRRQRVQIMVARAFRGIRTDSGGNTAYGDDTTEDAELQGINDWFFVQSDVEILTDGRLGFRIGLNGRNNRFFPFENHATGVPSGSGATTSPMVWNGLTTVPEPPATELTDARAYEMMLTMAIELDEDLWDQANIPDTGTRSIKKFGPLLEMYRDAGNEYGMEIAKHSLIQDFRSATGASKMVATPLVDGTGAGDVAARIYRDDRDEVAARVNMMANRHAIVDGEYELVLNQIDFSLTAGDYIAELVVPKDDPIKVGALVSSITHDFKTQMSTIMLSTVR